MTWGACARRRAQEAETSGQIFTWVDAWSQQACPRCGVARRHTLRTVVGRYDNKRLIAARQSPRGAAPAGETRARNGPPAVETRDVSANADDCTPRKFRADGHAGLRNIPPTLGSPVVAMRSWIEKAIRVSD